MTNGYYKARTQTVYAEQWDGTPACAKSMKAYLDGCLTLQNNEVDGAVSFSAYVTLGASTLKVKPGQWLVWCGQGRYSLLDDTKFEELYSASSAPDALTFGDALEAMRGGACVARAGWNGKGMHICLAQNLWDNDDTAREPLSPCVVMRTAQGDLQPGWLCSQPDMLACDWHVV